MSEIIAAAKLFEAQREVGYRKRVYARMVAEGRMSAVNAERGIAVMEAIRADYAKIVETQEATGRLI